MRSLPLLLAASLIAAPALADDSSEKAPSIAFDVSFVSHVKAGMPEQDVYVTRGPSQGKVFRPGPDDTNLDAPLFTAAKPQPHDPGNPAAIGPFKKGTKLDLTLGDWLGASGSGHYHVEDGEGHLTIEFEGLVPNGVYTLWHFFMVNGETDPFVGTFDLPIGTFDGNQSIFIADADGSATFDQSFDTALQLSGEQLTAGLAVNWHSDGMTYGVLPGAFGESAHIQLFTALPQRPDL